MKTATKAFDCVEMKNRFQAKLMEDYLAQKDRHASYLDFIKARSEKSSWVRKEIKRLVR